MSADRLLKVPTHRQPCVAALWTSLALLLSTMPAFATPERLECGAVIIQDTVLKNDVGPCTGDGLVIAASGITVNLNGHTVHATQRSNVGVRLENVSNVAVKGGTIEGFDAGVLVVSGLSNTVTSMTVRNNRFGIRMDSTPAGGHLIERNTVSANRLIGVFLQRSVIGATIRNNKVNGNTGFGIVVAAGSANNLIVGNEALGNGDHGIQVRGGYVVPGLTVISPPVLDLISPDHAPYIDDVDYRVIGANSGDVSGRLVPVDITLGGGATFASNPVSADTSTSGCEAADFTAAGLQPGDVALVQRGTCTLETKVDNAWRAGASALIIFNEGSGPTRTGLDFASPLALGFTPFAPIPVLSASYATGFELNQLARAGTVTIRVRSDAGLDILKEVGIPGTVNNLVTKNTATTASDGNQCSTNQWVKNKFEQFNDIPCSDGGGLGATTDAY